MLCSQLADLLDTQALSRKIVLGDAHHEIRIRTQTQPDVALAGSRHAWELACPVEEVGDDLKMQVWRPPPVGWIGTYPGERRSPGNGFAHVEASERVYAQVAVQREERENLVVTAGDSML